MSKKTIPLSRKVAQDIWKFHKEHQGKEYKISQEVYPGINVKGVYYIYHLGWDARVGLTSDTTKTIYSKELQKLQQFLGIYFTDDVSFDISGEIPADAESKIQKEWSNLLSQIDTDITLKLSNIHNYGSFESMWKAMKEYSIESALPKTDIRLNGSYEAKMKY